MTEIKINKKNENKQKKNCQKYHIPNTTFMFTLTTFTFTFKM